MKKLFTILFLSSFIVSNAQITSADMPVVGTSVNYKNINKNGFNTYPTTVGVGVTWDNSMVVEKIDSVILDYILPSTTPETDTFPTSTLAESMSGTAGHFFYSQDAGAFYRDGFFDPSQNLSIPYNDKLKLYTLPFQFGTTFSDTYSCTNGTFDVYPAKIDDGTYTSDVDGNGILKVPTGYFNNVFRIYYEENFTIKADIGLGSYYGMVNISEFGYEFWKSGHVKPLLTYYSTTTTDLIGGSGATVSVGVRYDKHAPVDGINVSVNTLNQENMIHLGTVSSGVFYINSIGSLQNSNLDVYDMLGKKVFTTHIGDNINKYVINLENLNSGLYILNISGKNISYSHKLAL